jgi:hypothetical protein
MNVPHTLDQLCKLPNDGKEVVFPVKTYFISGDELEKVRSTPMKPDEQEYYNRYAAKYREKHRNRKLNESRKGVSK